MRSFVDSNLLLYLVDDAESERQSIALQIYTTIVDRNELFLSTQVLNETYKNLVNPRSSTTRRKFTHIESRAIIAQILTEVETVIPLTTVVCLHGYDLADRHQLQFWDALILAAALEVGADEIYTEDVPGAAFTKGGMLEGIKYINPFKL